MPILKASHTYADSCHITPGYIAAIALRRASYADDAPHTPQMIRHILRHTLIRHTSLRHIIEPFTPPLRHSHYVERLEPLIIHTLLRH